MAPQPVTNPDRRFVLTRLDGGVETNVAVSTLLPSNFTTAQDQTLRATTYANARSLKATNPTFVYLLYGPTNGGAHTDGDRIWDSRVCE